MDKPPSRHLKSSHIQHLYPLLEGETQRWSQDFDRFEGVLLGNELELVLVLLSDAVEDIEEHVAHNL